MKLATGSTVTTFLLLLSWNVYAEIPNFLIGKWRPDLNESLRYMKENAALWHDEKEIEYRQRLSEWIDGKEIEFNQSSLVLRLFESGASENIQIIHASQQGDVYILNAISDNEAGIIIVSQYAHDTIHLKISSANNVDYIVWKSK